MNSALLILFVIAYIFLLHYMAKYISERTNWQYNSLIFLFILFSPLLGLLILLYSTRKQE